MTTRSSATLPELLVLRADGSRDVPLVFPGPREPLRDRHVTSIGAMVEDAARLAMGLADRCPLGARVLIVHPRPLGFLRSFYAASLAGLVPVPLAPPSLGMSLDGWLQQVRRVVQDCDGSLLLCDAEIDHLIESSESGEPAVGVARLTLESLTAQAPTSAMQPRSCDVAFLQYSSGSTGRPKGVVVRHEQLMANLAAIERDAGLNREDTFVSWLPMYHDMGLIGAVLGSLWAGCSGLYLSPVDFVSRPVSWLEEITLARGTFSAAPDFAYRLCAERIPETCLADLDLRSWRVALSGAERVRPDTLRRFVARFRTCGFDAKAFMPAYGLAEATLYVAGRQRGTGATIVELDGSEFATVGRNASNLRVLVVDPATCASVPPGEMGEIWVSGTSVTAGYWNNPPASDTTFRGFLASGEGPFLRTGDLGAFQEDELVICGRVADVLNVRGRNLYPEDVEDSAQGVDTRLRKGCGAVICLDDDTLVLLQETTETDWAAIDDLGSRIATSVMRTLAVSLDAIEFFPPRGLRKTSSGKLRRSGYRCEFQSGELQPIARWTRPRTGSEKRDHGLTHR